MVYINQAEITKFLNRAERKIASLGLLIAEKVQTEYYDDDMVLSQELERVVDFISSPYNPVAERRILALVHYYNKKAKLKVFPSFDLTSFQITINQGEEDSGLYALDSELASEASSRAIADGLLSGRIAVLENNVGNLDFQTALDDALANYTLTAGLFLPTGDNLTALNALTTALLTAIGVNSAHVSDGAIHVTQVLKEYWNAKVETDDARLSDSRTPLSHPHAIADITGILTEITNQVTTYVNSLGLEDGITPVISIGTVTEDVTSSATITGPVTDLKLNLVLVKGDTGDPGTPFVIGDKGIASDRLDAAYEAEDETFAYLGLDDGFLYYRDPTSVATSLAGWTTGIQFTGYNGWEPVIATYTVSSDKVVLELIDWLGGTGAKPVLPIPNNPPDPLRWYIGINGYVNDVSQATNIKGDIGPIGSDGERFTIDIAIDLADLGTYDSQPKGYTVLIEDQSPQVLYQKLSDTSGDWSPARSWQGNTGPAGASVGTTIHSGLTLDDGTNPHDTTKSDVGLSSVDNTADADKPVSTAQATADGLRLLKTDNLSDLENVVTARVNLGVYDIATIDILFDHILLYGETIFDTSLWDNFTITTATSDTLDVTLNTTLAKVFYKGLTYSLDASYNFTGIVLGGTKDVFGKLVFEDNGTVTGQQGTMFGWNSSFSELKNELVLFYYKSSTQTFYYPNQIIRDWLQPNITRTNLDVYSKAESDNLSGGGLSYKHDATVPPGVTNDINDTGASDGVGFVVGSEWYDTTSKLWWKCTDSTNGAAQWQIFTEAQGTYSETNSTNGADPPLSFKGLDYITLTLDNNVNELSFPNLPLRKTVYLRIEQNATTGYSIASVQGLNNPDGVFPDYSTVAGENSLWAITLISTNNILIEGFANIV
jgi:hypothetical protein